MKPLAFDVHRAAQLCSDQQRAAILANPGFGQYFTDHMVSIRWRYDHGWDEAQVCPYGAVMLDPAASVFHYGQEIFEGIKLYRHADGSIWTFRPQANAQRFMRSAQRLALPQLPAALFVQSLRELAQVDHAWVPSDEESSLYCRPFMIATEAFLGVRAANQARYFVIASPSGPYFNQGIQPIAIWVSRQYSRAGKGGTGAAKCGGNYAASLLPQQLAKAQGCSQVLFLDAVYQRYLEELGGMNLFVVDRNQRLITPALSGSILEGITRDSIITLAKQRGLEVVEQRLDLDEVVTAFAQGDISEMFACGTAAVITPIGQLKSNDFCVGDLSLPPGPVTTALRQELTDIQYARRQDNNNWMVRLV